nr:glutamine synthetase family protein [Bacteroidales bacterium]
IINFVEGNEIELINFRYVGEDGKLKTLNFIISSKEHLENMLSTGERVDGSSLFSFIEAGSSDLYVVPRFKTAFLNPFAEIPSVDILCSFYNSKGKPLESAPEYVLRKAHTEFTKATGFTFKALGELEFYINYDKEDLYPAVDQQGYHESKPYAKYEDFRVEALSLIGICGGKVKYGHSEVGGFSKENQSFEQHEIEFLPVNAEDAVDQMVVAKWVLRNLSNEYGVEISFAPKITVGKAGSGLHIHMMLEENGKNLMVQDGKLSDISKRMMAGILDLASSLTAFGNTVPTSYLRLVPHQEAPTNICWGDSNRSALVRVPLGWMGASNMVADANPLEKVKEIDGTNKQTVEFRAPDGSADLYHLVAGLIVASQHGLEMDNALEISEKLYIDVNIFDEKNKNRLEQLELLPVSCYESAECLEKKRQIYEKNNVFPKGLIENVITKIKDFNDKDLSERLYGKNDEIQKLVHKYIHCM